MSHEYDYDSPLSEKAQDSLINAQKHAGGRTGVASDDVLTELIKAKYITPNFNLTKAGFRESLRLYEHYWDEPYVRR